MKNVIIILLSACSLSCSAQSPNTDASSAKSDGLNRQMATVLVARKKLYTGAQGAVKIFMDGQIICEIENNAFTAHQVVAGEHTFSAQWFSKKSKKESDRDLDLKLTLQPGKQYFLQLATQNKGLITYALLQEITDSTWTRTKDGLHEDDCH